MIHSHCHGRRAERATCVSKSGKKWAGETIPSKTIGKRNDSENLKSQTMKNHNLYLVMKKSCEQVIKHQ